MRWGIKPSASEADGLDDFGAVRLNNQNLEIVSLRVLSERLSTPLPFRALCARIRRRNRPLKHWSLNTVE